MRVFSFIFIIYILLLSVMPCDEMTANAELRFDENSYQIQRQNNAPTDESGDDCSPFCICSCCHFSTAFQFKTFAVTSKITVSVGFKPENLYRNPYAQTYKTSIWQPPKI